MSIDIWPKYPAATVHDLSLTQYFGSPEKGQCIQLTGMNCDDRIGYVGMTRKEAVTVAYELLKWAQEDAERDGSEEADRG